MEEQILNARKGLMPLMLLVAAFALSVIALIAGISLVENNTLGGSTDRYFGCLVIIRLDPVHGR